MKNLNVLCDLYLFLNNKIILKRKHKENYIKVSKRAPSGLKPRQADYEANKPDCHASANKVFNDNLRNIENTKKEKKICLSIKACFCLPKRMFAPFQCSKTYKSAKLKWIINSCYMHNHICPNNQQMFLKFGAAVQMSYAYKRVMDRQIDGQVKNMMLPL